MKKPKADDLIVVKKTNGSVRSIGIVSVVTKVDERTINFKNEVAGNDYIYIDEDEFEFASREIQIEYFNKIKKDLNKKIKEAQKRIDFLEKYESEEDFVAEKLELIMSAHKTGKTKKERVSMMKDILSTLKESDLL